MQKVFFVMIGLCLLSLLAFSAPVSAQATGVSVTCDDGGSFNNGVEIRVIQMRSGFNYTATAIGLNGFDPVLAVLGESGDGLCYDDVPAAAGYQVNLPSTGQVTGSNLSSQVVFNHNDPSGFQDIRLVVGGFGNTTGEFVLILEGMAVTTEDVYGDPFRVFVTPGMLASAAPLNVYMISRENSLDPYMAVTDGGTTILNDSSGSMMACDDAGNPQLCWGTSASLASSFVTTQNGRLPGGQYDAMMSFDLSGLQLNADPEQNFFNMIFSSYNAQTTGQYVTAFHIKTAVAPTTGGTGGSKGDGIGANSQQTTPPQQQTAPQQQAGIPAGVSVTCDSGGSFNNGVEIRVIQMRSGFDYTATAIGLNGFDPVLAVLGESGDGLCYDNVPAAAGFQISLPSTGQAVGSQLSSQVVFNHSDPSGFQDIRLVVGGFGNTTGEFVLVLEGMAVTTEDVYGDPFRVFATPGMVASRVPLSVYMIARDSSLDPYMAVTDGGTTILNDSSGSMMACDDAGNPQLCWGTSASLASSFVTTQNGRLPGGQYDAMMSFDLSGLQLVADPSQNFFNLIFSSYNAQTTGRYIVAFHLGTSAMFTPDA